MTRQAKAYAYGASTVLLWSTVASAFKLALRGLDPAQLLFYASLTSLVLLGAVLAFRGRLRDALRLPKGELLRSAGLGFLSPFLYYLILFRAYDLLPAQVAQPLNYTWAIVLALLSVPLLRQRITARDIAASLVCYSGVVVISLAGGRGPQGPADPVGVALALASTVVWALYWIWHTRDRRDPVEALFASFLFGTPLTLAWCVLVSRLVPQEPAALVAAVYVGVVEMGVAFVLWLSALRLSDNTSRIGNLIFVSPFLSLVFIRAVVGESIRSSTLVGLGLIVGGLLLQSLGRRGRGGMGAPASGRPPARQRG